MALAGGDGPKHPRPATAGHRWPRPDTSGWRFADIALRQVQPSHIEAWVKSLTVPTQARTRALAPGTIKTRFVNVRPVFRATVRDGLIATDPTTSVRLPRLHTRDAAMTIPTPDVVRRILHASDPLRPPVAVRGGPRPRHLGRLVAELLGSGQDTQHSADAYSPCSLCKGAYPIPCWGCPRARTHESMSKPAARRSPDVTPGPHPLAWMGASGRSEAPQRGASCGPTCCLGSIAVTPARECRTEAQSPSPAPRTTRPPTSIELTLASELPTVETARAPTVAMMRFFIA